jgi:hypothetical protein
MKTKLRLIVMLGLLSTIAFGQAGPAVVTKTSVGIYNTSNNDIKILLGETDSTLDTFMIQKNSLWYSGFYKKNPLIRIKTGENIVTYSIRLNNYYLIYWNKKKKYWDLKRTTKK